MQVASVAKKVLSFILANTADRPSLTLEGSKCNIPCCARAAQHGKTSRLTSNVARTCRAQQGLLFSGTTYLRLLLPSPNIPRKVSEIHSSEKYGNFCECGITSPATTWPHSVAFGKYGISRNIRKNTELNAL
jgi:hypothetical protein